MIGWLAKRRLNFVDLIFIGFGTAFLREGRYLSALCVILAGAAISALIEIIAEMGETA